MPSPAPGATVRSALVAGSFAAALVLGGVSYLLTGNPTISAYLGAAAGVLTAASGFLLWFRTFRKSLEESRKKSFYELQDFLLRSRMLPEDFKPHRDISSKELDEARAKLMELGSAASQEQSRRLAESHHVLDKFIGTKASQFALQKGKKAVWEGELVRMILLFSDVRGFTSMTGKLKTQETVRFLNRMYTELEEIITFSGGEINKYMGDAILAFFPAAAESADASIKKALLAALRMQDAFHQQQIAFREHYSVTVEPGLGVGMAMGDVIIGNIGSARRMEFTLIGDTVNLASRLCSIAADNQVLINQDLASRMQPFFRMTELPPVQLKGITGTHVPYVVMGEKLNTGLA